MSNVSDYRTCHDAKTMAEQCRAKAERLREIAETAENDGERRILIEIADDYAELAALMDRRRISAA